MADEQDRAAAERSADVNRGGFDKGYRDYCWVCGGPWAKGGASHTARHTPFREACSATCAASPAFIAPQGAPQP